MAWIIHIRRGDQRHRHEAQELSAALAVACLFLRSGIEVERIEGPDGMEIVGAAVRPLCGEAS
jgi:hypothetical protein